MRVVIILRDGNISEEGIIGLGSKRGSFKKREENEESTYVSVEKHERIGDVVGIRGCLSIRIQRGNIDSLED